MPSVRVTWDGVKRPVFIDNQNQGMTDTILSVAEGLHVFDLGLPPDYQPPFQEVFIEDAPGGTVVPFTVMAAVVARARKRRAAARKRVSAGKRKRSARAGLKTGRKTAAKKRTTVRRKRSTRKKR
jgi:hypothetical protein